MERKVKGGPISCIQTGSSACVSLLSLKYKIPISNLKTQISHSLPNTKEKLLSIFNGDSNPHRKRRNQAHRTGQNQTRQKNRHQKPQPKKTAAERPRRRPARTIEASREVEDNDRNAPTPSLLPIPPSTPRQYFSQFSPALSCRRTANGCYWLWRWRFGV